MLDFDFKEMIWQNDYTGDEYGIEGVGIVGVYEHEKENGEKHMYALDMETMEVLETWRIYDEDEEEAAP